MLEKGAWRDFFAVTFSIAIVGIGLGCTLPLTALALTRRGFGPNVVGWMIAASALGGVCGTFVTPSVVARIGRRKIMIGCFILATLSIAPLQFFVSIPSWLMLQFLFGVSMAALFLIGESWINVLPSDSHRGRVVAIYTTSFTLFQVLGPLFTDWVSGFPQTAFLLCGALFMLGIPAIFIARDDARAHVETSSPTDANVGNPAEQVLPWFVVVRRGSIIIAGVAFFASFDSIILGFLPLVALDSGFSQSRALTAATIVLAGDASLQYVAGWMSDHFGRARIHRLCGLAVCLLLPLLHWALQLPIVWALYLFCLGGFSGAIYTLSMVASGDKFGGTSLLRIAGLIGLTWNISSAVGPAATGLLMQRFGSMAMVSVLWVIALVFLLVARDRKILTDQFPTAG